ncbi:hypothetical protein [Spirobacillus cienkowskii]|uniref:hypothetical protein n=1 Tax=Spirobacillus cienkowskii TaxID=495820 RepID=UPI0030D1E0FF
MENNEKSNCTDSLATNKLKSCNDFLSVTLFLKFIKEDFQKNGDLLEFDLYYKENNSSFASYSEHIQEQRFSIMNNSYVPSKIQKKVDSINRRRIEFEKTYHFDTSGPNLDAMSNEERLRYENEAREIQKKYDKYNNTAANLKDLYTLYNITGQKKELTNFVELNPATLENFLEENDADVLFGEDKINDFLLRSTSLIYSVVQDRNLRIVSTHCHTQHEAPFLRKLEQDIECFSIYKNLDYSYFYYIQEVSNSKKIYGIFLYARFNEPHLVFYYPNKGIEQFSIRNISNFRKMFQRLINNYGGNYCSFKIKIKSLKFEIQSLTTQYFYENIIIESCKKYLLFLNTKKALLLNQQEKSDKSLCENFVTNSSSKFYDKRIFVSQFLIKLLDFNKLFLNKKYSLKSKSYWIFFLIEYIYKDTKFAQKKINEFVIFADDLKIHQFVLDFYNNKNSDNNFKSVETISYIYSGIIKQLSKNSVLMQYYIYYKSITITNGVAKIADLFFCGLKKNTLATFTDWKRKIVVYNQKIISKSCNKNFEEFNSLKNIANYKTFDSNQNRVLIHNDALKSNLESVTQNCDAIFINFCMDFCNQNEIFNLEIFLDSYMASNYYIKLDFSMKYLFIEKTNSHEYLFICIHLFENYQILNKSNSSKVKLENNICFTMSFTLNTSQLKYQTSDLSFGFLDFTKTNINYPNESLIKKNLTNALNSKELIQFLQSGKSKGSQRVFYT